MPITSALGSMLGSLMSGSTGSDCAGRTTGRIRFAEPRHRSSISRQVTCARCRYCSAIQRRKHRSVPRRRHRGCARPCRRHGGIAILISWGPTPRSYVPAGCLPRCAHPSRTCCGSDCSKADISVKSSSTVRARRSVAQEHRRNSAKRHRETQPTLSIASASEATCP